MSISKEERIISCFLLGASGDALGASIENLSLQKIRNLYGTDGLASMIAHLDAYGEGIDHPAGSITDDTTMSMTVLSALRMTLAKNSVSSPAFVENLRDNLWQGFLNWGKHQDSRPEIAAKIDASIAWPDDVKAFWFKRGAGRGTIAALCQDKPGKIDDPQIYDMIIRGKETKSPNAGCGGMMRVAALAFLPVDEEKLFQFACASAAITNGHPDAYVATGVIALMIRHAAEEKTTAQSLSEITRFLHSKKTDPAYSAGADSCLRAIETAQNAFVSGTQSYDKMNALPKSLGYANPFLAIPVLAQVIYATLHAENAQDTRKTMLIAINHGGDSDSIGAIVGNILGAKHGQSALQQDWLKDLMPKAAIANMAQRLYSSLHPDPPPRVRIQPPNP